MHHLHENTLPCYHESLYNVLNNLRNSDLQIATRIFLRQGYFPGKNQIKIITFAKEAESAQLLLARAIIFL